MSILTHFQPQQNSILKPKASRRFLDIHKHLGLKSNINKLKTENNLQRERIFKQSCQSLGSPDSKYLLKKIRGYLSKIQNFPKRRGYTEPRISNRASSRNSIEFEQRLSSSSFRHIRQCSQSVEKALMLNQEQKIQRIILKRSQEQQKQKCLSERIKIKLAIPRIRVPGADNPKPIQKLTWYKKWFKVDDNQKSRKKIKIFRRLKTQQVKRLNTQQILSSIDLQQSR